MRILHRDIGFFFVGTSIIYGLSGIALNHAADWNPNYSVDYQRFNTDIDLRKSSETKENVLKLLDEIDNRKNYKKHYYPNRAQMKIFLKGGSYIAVNIDSGEGEIERLKKRPVFYQVNYLHYNPHAWWKWFSDIFAVALIFLAVSSLFMVRGKKGVNGRGGIYVVAGVLMPVIFLIFNFADIAVIGSVVLMLLVFLVRYLIQKKLKKPE